MKQLKVLHINKFHVIVGGAEAIYFRTAEILEKHGHSSVFFAMGHPNNLPCETAEYFMPYIDIENMRGITDYVMAISRNLYSFKARRLVSMLLDRYPVDIVHMHNIHRQMSPSILYEFKKRGIPTVMTLHEYKTICPSYIMMCRDKPCEACSHGKYINAVKLRCVKGSFLRSSLVAVEMYLHHKLLDIYDNVDVFIAPSMFMKRKHEEMGFTKKIVHLPYPLDCKGFDKYSAPEKVTTDNGRISMAYFGRLFPDKGLFTLIEALKILSRKELMNELKVRIIGVGPIEEELRKRVRDEGIINVDFPGFLNGDDLFTELKKHDAIIIPSEWYENYPVSVMESFALGKPVIGARIGGIPEMVMDNRTGLTFESGNAIDLSEKIELVINNPDKASEWGKNAKEFIEGEVNPEKHYKELMKIYEMVIVR